MQSIRAYWQHQPQTNPLHEVQFPRNRWLLGIQPVSEYEPSFDVPLCTPLWIEDFFCQENPCIVSCRSLNNKTVTLQTNTFVEDATPCLSGTKNLCVNGECMVMAISIDYWLIKCASFEIFSSRWVAIGQSVGSQSMTCVAFAMATTRPAPSSMELLIYRTRTSPTQVSHTPNTAKQNKSFTCDILYDYQGYYSALHLPIGSSNIMINDNTQNFLALQDTNGMRCFCRPERYHQSRFLLQN